LTHVVEDEPAAIAAHDVFALDLNHPLEIVEGTIELMQLPLGEAAKIKGPRILGIEVDQQPVIRNRTFEIADGEIRLCPASDCHGMARVAVEHFGKIADREIGIPLFQMGETAAKQAIDPFPIDPDCAIEVGDGGVEIALPAVGLRAAVDVRGQHTIARSDRLNGGVAPLAVRLQGFAFEGLWSRGIGQRQQNDSSAESDPCRMRQGCATRQHLRHPLENRLPSFFHLRRLLELTINGQESGSNSSLGEPTR
jgi:hypothetical protein